MQTAKEWLRRTSRIASLQSEMGSSVTAGLAFKLKRLTREYDAHSHGTLGSLSMAGTVPAIDVDRAFVVCKSYKLILVKGLVDLAAQFENGELQRYSCCNTPFFKACLQDVDGRKNVVFACTN